MANLTFFQDEFNRYARNGVLGDPQGVPAYAYLRVSSSAQAEEGRSGLPRQIARVHEIAAQSGIYIPWELVFADDHTGFQFADRPELSRLRAEYVRPDRKANIVVIEYLDRLSRNADWHQGFLLDEMAQHKVQILFWKGFTSRIERAVMGAISQDGMERSMEIMHEGMLDKARDGRITAKVPAFGYVIVDSEGKQSPKASRETHYAIDPAQAEIVRIIYHKVGIEAMSTYELCRYLEERFPPPGKSKHWHRRQIVLFIRSPLYKGEYYANRATYIKAPAKQQRPGEPVRLVTKKIERPSDEWILVPVPSIVSTELWQLANDMLDQNARMAARNAKDTYLLTGLLKCAECGYTYNGGMKRRRWISDPSKLAKYRYYMCNSKRGRPYYDRVSIGCSQGRIPAGEIEDAVWKVVTQIIMQPELLLAELDRQLDDDSNASLKQQIAFLKRQINDSGQEDEKLYRAFLADVFDEHEFSARRKLLKEKVATLTQELEKLNERIVTHEEIEKDKASILAFANHAKESGFTKDAPFAVKQRLLKLLINTIYLNRRERQFRIEGHISGIWLIDTVLQSDFSSDKNYHIESNPA